MFVPHSKHITLPLGTQQVNAIYRIVTMVSCLFLKQNVSETAFYIRLQVEPPQLDPTEN
jgi:hypothetical protein